MQKNEFLEELRRKLKCVSKKECEERVGFYDEMIEDMIADGKSEEEAVNEVGNVDDIVKQVISETPLLSLVKEKIKPKRTLKWWEITMLILGFPIFLALFITIFALAITCYVLIWVGVLVAYSIELSLAFAGLSGIVCFVAFLVNGEINLITLGIGFLCAGLSLPTFFGCVKVTSMTLRLSKKIIIKIKSLFVKKEEEK